MVITGTYDLIVNPFWRNVQQQEVYLECDTFSGPVTINLFPIANLNRFWNVKINIVDLSQNCSVNNITINTGSVGTPPVQDTVDQLGNTQIILNKNGESVIFSVVSENQWLAGESITIPFAVQSVTGLNTDNTDPLNPIVKVSLANNTITGQGTPASPLVSNIVINTSQIISGTSGRVLFNKSNAVSESSDFNFDDVNVVLSLGGTTSGTKGRLNIKASNASASSFSIAIRKSDDSGYLFQTLNDGKIRINDTFNITNIDGTAGQSLVTDGAGNVSFQDKQDPISLTTTGNSGASSFAANVLNVPVYTLSGLGGVPTSRTLTINGTTQDLSADRTWTIPIGITVGTTPSSGTDGRVFFQAGGVVQQDANFTFDNTLKRLTLKAVGTASTDIPFAVQNSAGTANIIQAAGDNSLTFLSSAGKAIFSSSGGAILSMRRDYTNEEMVKINAGDYPSIEVKPINTTSNISVGTLANGASIHWDNTAFNFQIKNSFHNLFHVVGNTNSATATLRLGTIATNTNFFNLYGPNAGGTGINATQLFNVNSNGNVGIGMVTTGARLDIKAQGALSTDIAFRVRNSADTYNISDIQGDSIINFRVNSTATASSTGLNLLGTNTEVVINAKSTNTGGTPNVTGFFASGGGGSVGLYTDYAGKLGAPYAGVLRFNTASTDRMNFVNASNNCSGWAFLQTSPPTYALGNTVFAIYPTNAQAGGGTLALGTTLGTTVSSLPAATYGKNTFFIANGTAPTTAGADAFGIYSADITAGNAAPHFRTEAGDIIKLYKETTAVTAATLVSGLGTPLTDTDTFDGYTLQQVVKVLKNLGILQ